jgi:hypothetical protein
MPRMSARQARCLLTTLSPMPDQGVRNMTKTALSALVAAWTASMIATSSLVVAFMLSRVWDTAVYLKGLQRVLISNLEGAYASDRRPR